MATVQQARPAQQIIVRPPSSTPTPNDFRRARVTNPSQSEIVRQRLYDYQLLAAAGS